MNIGLYLQTFHVGGVAVYCQRLARGLAELGHEARVILATPFGKHDLDGRRAYEELARSSLPSCCLHLNAFHPKERAWRAAEAMAALGCEALILSAHRSIAGGLPALRAHMPLLGIAHTDEEGSYEEFALSEAACEAYIGVSSSITEKLRQLRRTTPPIEVRHIPSGVPEPKAGLGPGPAGPAKILVVCRLVRDQKRVLDLPLIWERFRARGGQATLTLCGSGDELESLRRSFATEIAGGRVTLTGAVPAEQLSAVYAGHDILLSVSAFEGLPLVVLEAAMHGLLPVLSETRSGHREIVEALGQGRLCAIGDVEGFAATLLEVTRDLSRLRAQRAGVAERARAQFSLRRMVETCAQLVNEIVARRAKLTASGAMAGDGAFVRHRVDPLRSWIRRFQYNRHYGTHWQVGQRFAP